MKKLFFIAIFLLGSNVLSAQEGLTKAEQFLICSSRLEVNAGVNVSNHSGQDLSDSESSKFRTGINIGVNVYQEIMSGLSFGTGIAFEQKGSNYEYNPGDFGEFPEGLSQANLINGSNTSSYRTLVGNDPNKLQSNSTLSYLTFPLNIGYAPIKKHNQFRVQAGLVPGVLLSRNTNTNSFGFERSESGTENFRTIDLGLMLGASYIFKNNIGVMMAYDHGLINTNAQEFGQNAFNRTIKLMAFYRLNFNPITRSSYQ